VRVDNTEEIDIREVILTQDWVQTEIAVGKDNYSFPTHLTLIFFPKAIVSMSSATLPHASSRLRPPVAPV